MISASDARKMSRNNEIISFILEEVDSKIKEAASQGKFCAIYRPNFELNYSIYCLILPAFTKLGYKIAWFNNLNQLLVSWEENK